MTSLRRLRAQIHRLEENADDLPARLAYAHVEIEQLRARLIEVTRPMRTAAPRGYRVRHDIGQDNSMPFGRQIRECSPLPTTLTPPDDAAEAHDPRTEGRERRRLWYGGRLATVQHDVS